MQSGVGFFADLSTAIRGRFSDGCLVSSGQTVAITGVRVNPQTGIMEISDYRVTILYGNTSLGCSAILLRQ